MGIYSEIFSYSLECLFWGCSDYDTVLLENISECYVIHTCQAQAPGRYFGGS